MHIPSPHDDDLTPIWRLLLVRAAIVLGLSLAALPWPVMSVSAMLMLVSGTAIAAGILDAAMSGALQRRLTSSWVLLPEAVVGILLGIAVLLYPLVPLTLVAVLITLWMVARGIMLAGIARGAASDTMMRVVAAAWTVASVLAPTLMIVNWDQASIIPIVYLLVAYSLVWSLLELTVGVHLRTRALAARTPA